MPAKTGQQYIDNLKKAKNNVYIHGERVKDVTTHPAFKGAVQSMAKLYDLQYEKPEKMLYTSPTTGDKVGKTFMAPETIEDLIERREAIMEWQGITKGLMGRSPDYLNSEVMTMEKAYDYYGKGNPQFAENARKYAEYARENDISLTHTLIHPQVNRAKIQAEQKDANVALHVVEKNDDGVIVDGIRLLATQAGITDEIFVFPSTVVRTGAKDDPYSLAFAIPNNTPGLKYLSREGFDYGKNGYDHPVGSQFEEGDAIVSFDNVLVPWDRIFILEDSEICNGAFAETNAVVHMSHQVIAKDVAKVEFLLGVVLKLMDSIGIDGFQHVKDKGTEIMLTLENMKSHLYKAEHNAKIDKWGMMTPDFEALNAARNWFPRVYPRLAEILRILGASGLMGIPTYDDFASAELGPILNRAMQGKNVEGFERVQLFRLAWDMTMSSFGSRQTHYEYYFFGDPVKMGMAYFDNYNKEPYKAMVDEFLESQNIKKPSILTNLGAQTEIVLK
ncbi:4-hydroxyphenylacetate 3-monooxygenase, oxygenase component [Oceanobacillus profundus]|uniref:4-hydroxyphenylacetate 3-monooxygenase, oxygenase component n=1 Tax=Oceanobacillus profundus TaxID=372463 RepID=UPI00362C2ED0